MSFAQDTGYTSVTFSDMMSAIRLAINSQFGTSYTVDNFVGTNWYKYFYTLVQKAVENETKTAEIFANLQAYISTTNARIQRPSVSLPGIIDSLTSAGFVGAVKKNLLADAGTVSICVNLDNTAGDYATKKLTVAGLIRDFVTAGMVTQGTEVTALTLSNGQSFNFSYYLPTKTPIILRLTVTATENQTVTVPTSQAIRLALFSNINARYQLGWDFEPQRYYTQIDAPWAASIKLEWSSNAGSTWNTTVNLATFRDLFTFGLADITVVGP